jgi:hypothetical protein
MLKSIFCRCVFEDITRVASASQTTKSASEPTAIVPFWGKMLKIFAVLVEVTFTNSLGVIFPVLTAESEN